MRTPSSSSASWTRARKTDAAIGERQMFPRHTNDTRYGSRLGSRPRSHIPGIVAGGARSRRPAALPSPGMIQLPPPAASAEAVLDHIGPDADIIIPLANGEPAVLLDAIEAHGDHL